MWIIIILVSALLMGFFIGFLVLFWKRKNEELLRLDNRIEKYNTTIALIIGFLITFMALTFNNKLAYEVQIQKAEIEHNPLLSKDQQKEIINLMELSHSDKTSVGYLAAIDLVFFLLLLMFGTFLPGEILKSLRNRKIYFVTFIGSFYLLILLIGFVVDNLER